jgi:ATP-dependent RNA helicase RhlE
MENARRRPSGGQSRGSFGGPRRQFGGGGGRPSFSGGAPQGRGGSRSGGARRGQYIHPSKFINKAVTAIEEIPYEPQNKFADFPLNHRLHANIAAKGYVLPSAIQDQAIPHALTGKDIIGLANTGTGKTAAFLIPVIEKIQYLDTAPNTLIITPTRELATQIEDEFRSLAAGMRLYSTVVVGGMNIERQIRDLQRRPHVIIATPGRLKDLIQRRAVDLRSISTLILDEADRMLDMGFLVDIKMILGQLPTQRQSLCFSATITPAIAQLIDGMLDEPVTISVRTSETSDHVEQDVVEARKEHRLDVLVEMLNNQEFEKVLVFGETKFGVKRLAEALSKSGHAAESIHGNKTQSQRQRALDQFKKNQIKVLVATDVAARGLDIPNVSHVINFDQPMTYDDYVHRIGRTGRGGKHGKALTFIEPRHQ